MISYSDILELSDADLDLLFRQVVTERGIRRDERRSRIADERKASVDRHARATAEAVKAADVDAARQHVESIDEHLARARVEKTDERGRCADCDAMFFHAEDCSFFGLPTGEHPTR